VRLAVAEVDELGVQRPELLHVGRVTEIPAPRSLQAGVDTGSKHCVVDSHIPASADLGNPFCTVGKHGAVEEYRVAAQGELRGRGRRGSSHGLVPAGAFLTPRVREGIIEEAEEEIDGEVHARRDRLSQQPADGRFPDG